MAHEINLVPNIKGEMIKALKMRNFIFFLCIIIASASIAVTAIAGVIAGGQQAAVDGKKEMINKLSAKINSYSDLNDFLTIKDQLGSLSTLSSNKKVLSRTFNILSALIPTGVDTITISELSVNLSSDSPTFSFDAQANAGKEPFIDYNVLDSFKKSMKYMRYDYGNYVDRNGSIIPAYCIIEKNLDGSFLNDQDRGIYAFWTINEEGCNPSTQENSSTASYNTEEYDGKQVVRIWRTPQFNDWYKQTQIEDQPYMSLDGQISGVEHFASQCITYTGNNNAGTIKWTENNESCLLVPGGDDGIKISDSSNGRGANDDLVLRFSATITLSSDVFSFSRNHVLAIAPSGRHNVTDSYVQIQAMFGERAADCADGDTACNTNTNNGGNQ